MAKTRIYFDVDGVFNALPVGKRFPTEDETGWSQDSWERKKINGYWITYSRELVDAVNELSARDDVEVVWLTTWVQDAASMIAPRLGLNADDWRVLGTREDVAHIGYSWWKLDLLRDDFVNNPVDRIIWIDDDHAVYFNNTLQWVQKQDEGRVRLVQPYTDEGITRDIIEGIYEFLDSV